MSVAAGAESLSSDDENALAPDFEVEDKRIIVVEHPGVVEDKDRAIESLGGRKRLQEFLVSNRPKRRLEVYLNPGEDSFRRPIASDRIDTNNLVVEFEVPHLVGRRKKARLGERPGEIEPLNGESADPHATLMRTLADNDDNFELRVLADVTETRRFLDLPDLQYSLADSDFASRLKAGFPLSTKMFEPGNFTLMPDFFPDLENVKRMKDFTLDTEKRGDRDDIEITPSPAFLFDAIQYDYGYSLSAYNTEIFDDAGKKRISNRAMTARTSAYMLDNRSARVPSRPKPDLVPEPSVDPYMRHLIMDIRAVFNQRAIVTRRSILNSLPDKVKWDLRYGLQYCAYSFRSGPWKDTYIRFGVDPRKDPMCRRYQTIANRLNSREEKLEARENFPPTGRSSHIFDGKDLSLDSTTWIVEDITDPILKRIIDNAEPAPDCELREDGWFQNCTHAKLRFIVRDKVKTILRGETPDDSKYESIIDLPETAHDLPKDVADYKFEHQEMMSHFKTMLKADPRVYTGRR